MKRVIHALIFVLALVPLMLLMRWGGEAKAPWSAPRDGVSARLVAPRFLWKADEPVPIFVRFRNTSDQPRALPFSAHLILRIHHEGALVVEEMRDVALGVEGDPLLPAHGERDVRVRAEPLNLEGSGLYALDASVADFSLPAVKIRLVRRRNAAP